MEYARCGRNFDVNCSDFVFSVLCLFGAYLLGGALYRYFSLGIRGTDVCFTFTNFLHISKVFISCTDFLTSEMLCTRFFTGNPKFGFLGHCTSQNTGIVFCFYILSWWICVELNSVGFLLFLFHPVELFWFTIPEIQGS